MKIGSLTLPTFSSPAKIGVVAALVLALSASGGFGALFLVPVVAHLQSKKEIPEACQQRHQVTAPSLVTVLM